MLLVMVIKLYSTIIIIFSWKYSEIIRVTAVISSLYTMSHEKIL